jgi:hypothetical protein
MRTHIVLSLAAALLVAGIAPAKSPKPTLPATLDYSVGGQPWLRTMAAPHDTANREETYKVFTHILSFDGKGPITKGAGGKFTHHRGLFIGWKDTMVNGVDLDTWHMPNCYQQLVSTSEANGVQTLGITWNDLENKPFITEERTLAAKADGDVRVIDFGSKLTALEHKIELKGDLQHAGMQLRMAQEVADHEDSTSYILPEGAQRRRRQGHRRVVGLQLMRGGRQALLAGAHVPPQHPGRRPRLLHPQVRALRCLLRADDRAKEAARSPLPHRGEREGTRSEGLPGTVRRIRSGKSP